jgi:hypothetical protein
MSLRGRVERMLAELDDRTGVGRPKTVFLIPDNGRGHPGVGVYETPYAVTVIYPPDSPPELPAGVPLADALERLAVTLAAAVAEKDNPGDPPGSHEGGGS